MATLRPRVSGRSWETSRYRHLLFVTRDSADTTAVVLIWTGSSQQFEVYRADAAASLLEPFNLIQTVSTCTAADVTPAGPAFFYNVVPTGP
jgi:hypothetical protein